MCFSYLVLKLKNSTACKSDCVEQPYCLTSVSQNPRKMMTRLFYENKGHIIDNGDKLRDNPIFAEMIEDGDKLWL